MTIVALAAMLTVSVAVSLLLVTRPDPAPAEKVRRIGDIGGPFTLIDHRGRTVTQADFVGSPFIVFFGFTSCPDVCPTALSYALTALDGLPGVDTAPVNILLVSVDPARDTPERLTEYVTAFDGRVVGLTGSDQQVGAMAETYRVFYQKTPPDAAGNYSVDHSGSIFLMDRSGKFASTLDVHEPIETATAKLAGVIGRE
jgi:protein SCO1/2